MQLMAAASLACCSPSLVCTLVVQLVASEFGGGWRPDQLMHIWRRHQQRAEGPGRADAAATTAAAAEALPVAPRKGKWTPEEDDLLLKVCGCRRGRA